MTEAANLEARQAAWQARIKRACLYMLGVPVVAFGLLRRGIDPIPVLIGVMAVIILFITFVLWTYAKI